MVIYYLKRLFLQKHLPAPAFDATFAGILLVDEFLPQIEVAETDPF